MDTKAVEGTIIKRVSEALRTWEAQQADHDVPSPSGIANCFRAQWAKATKQEVTNPDQLAWIKNMEQGKLVEPFWSDIFRLAGFTVVDLNERLTIAGGPMTGVGDRMITDDTGEIAIPLLIELKNLGPFSYYELMKHGIRNGAPHYYYQIQSYLEMYNIPMAIIFAGQAEASSITWWWRVREKKQSGINATEWPPPFIVEVVERAPADFAWAQQREPRFIHGFGEVLAGIFWEPPKTVLDATLTGPPVVGTAVGIVGGLSRGIHRVVRGLREIDQVIRPHRGKRSGRR